MIMGVWKATLVQSNHSRLSIILPPSLPPSSLSPPAALQRCLQCPLHYSQLTSQKIRVKLGRPSSFGSLFSSLFSHHPSFYFSPITPSSLVGIWRVTLGQFNLFSLSNHSVCWSATAPCLYLPIQPVVTLFCASHTPPALLHICQFFC